MWFIGDSHARTPGSKSFRFVDDLNGIYKKIVVSEDRTKLLGAILVGEAEEYGTLHMMLNEMALPEDPGALILPTSDGAGAGLGVDALPDEATICFCHNVTKGDLARVDDGATTIGEIKSCTKAGTAAVAVPIVNKFWIANSPSAVWT